LKKLAEKASFFIFYCVARELPLHSVRAPNFIVYHLSVFLSSDFCSSRHRHFSQKSALFFVHIFLSK